MQPYFANQCTRKCFFLYKCATQSTPPFVVGWIQGVSISQCPYLPLPLPLAAYFQAWHQSAKALSALPRERLWAELNPAVVPLGPVPAVVSGGAATTRDVLPGEPQHHLLCRNIKCLFPRRNGWPIAALIRCNICRQQCPLFQTFLKT
jgi:hypothetical protein